jgi:hypothetical protein
LAKVNCGKRLCRAYGKTIAYLHSGTGTKHRVRLVLVVATVWEGANMTDISVRLERGAVALAVIDLRRRQTQDYSIGASAERFIIERELKELAAEAVAPDRRGGSREIRPRQRRRVLLATAGRWFRKQSQ